MSRVTPLLMTTETTAAAPRFLEEEAKRAEETSPAGMIGVLALVPSRFREHRTMTMLLASSSGRALCKNLSRQVPLAKTRTKATLSVQLLSVYTVTLCRCRLELADG
jgi:hypothetical protein